VDGELYMWGWNVYGQCGLGLDVENQLTPVLVEQLRGNTNTPPAAATRLSLTHVTLVQARG
jgi:alpha-tubulin suppressor-like RCC1 family protein